MNAVSIAISAIDRSCAVFICALVCPIRFAGTCRAYSAAAISQEKSMAFQSGQFANFKCKYHATIIMQLDKIKRQIVKAIAGPLFIVSSEKKYEFKS